MSRIGRMPITVPAGVTVTIADANVVTVKGALGTLTQQFNANMIITLDGAVLTVARPDDEPENRAMHGLTRALLADMVTGVSAGYSKTLQIVGVGYKATLAGNKLTLNLGYSHPINYVVPDGIKMNIVDGVKIQISGIDKQLVGEVAARIRRYKKPEPYKGKGVRYSDEHVVIKPGKTNA